MMKKGLYDDQYGYSLPISPRGRASLVTTPPWYFGGDLHEVIFETDASVLKNFLPVPLQLVPKKPWVSISMVDMISTSSLEEATSSPERTQYKECLIKLYCSLNNDPFWYVPISWVTADFSLLRGFIMGFGKKMGSIHITKYHEMHPLLGNKKVGSLISCHCESPHNMRIATTIKLTKKVDFDTAPVSGMCVTRHFPSIQNGRDVEIRQLTKLVVKDYAKKEVWQGTGTVHISGNEEIAKLQPTKIISARIASEGFCLTGTELLFDYKHL